MTNETNSGINSIEVTAPSLDEAVREALESLGAQEDDVIIEILSTPRSGLLGLGSRPAKVRVTRKAPFSVQTGVITPSGVTAVGTNAPSATAEASRDSSGQAASESTTSAHGEQVTVSNETVSEDAPQSTAQMQKSLEEQRDEAVSIIRELMELMGEKVEIEAQTTDLQDSDTAAIDVNLKGENPGLLIGRRGQTLDALEYIVNRILARRIEGAVPVMLDVESYNARRSQRLQRTALSLGEKVKRQHKTVRLKPMPPRERRVIHMTLRDDPLLKTQSTGSGYLRAVKIIPVGEAKKNETNQQQQKRARG